MCETIEKYCKLNSTGAKTKPVAPPSEDIVPDEDARPVPPPYNPEGDNVTAGSGNIPTNSAQPEAMYAEITTLSAAKL